MASPDIPIHLDDLLIPAENYFKFTFFIYESVHRI